MENFEPFPEQKQFKPYLEAWEWLKDQNDPVKGLLDLLLKKDAIDKAIEQLPEDYPIDDLLEMKPNLTDKRSSDTFRDASIVIDYRWMMAQGGKDLESREVLAKKYYTTAVHIFRLLKKFQ